MSSHREFTSVAAMHDALEKTFQSLGPVPPLSAQTLEAIYASAPEETPDQAGMRQMLAIPVRQSVRFERTQADIADMQRRLTEVFASLPSEQAARPLDPGVLAALPALKRAA